MSSAEFDAADLEARSGAGWTTLTELADTLSRERGLPFHTAHAICARLVAAREENPDQPLSASLAEAAGPLARTAGYSDADLSAILSPRRFVEVRRTWGGPAPEETRRAAAASRDQLTQDEGWWTAETAALEAAEAHLRERAARL
jgi:argininosuccinate lyase